MTTATDTTTQAPQPSDADVQVRVAALADTCASSLSDVITDVQDTMLELAERFNEVKEFTDPVDFWQLILDHVDDDNRKLAMEIFGEDVADLIALPLDVLKSRMANYTGGLPESRGPFERLMMEPVARGDGAVSYAGSFLPFASRAPLQPKTHRDRMRALVTKLLAESPRVEGATEDDIGAITCIVILRGGYQQRGSLKPSDDGETLRFMTMGKVNTDRGERIHAMEMVFDYDDLTAIVTEKAVADADKPTGIFG